MRRKQENFGYNNESTQIASLRQEIESLLEIQRDLKSKIHNYAPESQGEPTLNSESPSSKKKRLSEYQNQTAYFERQNHDFQIQKESTKDLE
jgi:hypothetical protein